MSTGEAPYLAIAAAANAIRHTFRISEKTGGLAKQLIGVAYDEPFILVHSNPV